MTLQAVLRADESWSRRISIVNRPGFVHRAAALLAHSADSWFWLAGLGVIWLFSGPAYKAWALRLILSILGVAGVVMALKFAIRRRRPEGDWGAIYRTTDPHSFPSGHAARVALLATLVAAWGPAWLAPVLFLWAPLVALARVALDLHYLSDVAAGMVLGAALGALALFAAPLLPIF